MKILNLLLDSESRIEGTRTKCRFSMYQRYKVSNIRFRFFSTDNVFSSTRSQDYVLINISNPFNEGVFQPGKTINNHATFVVPYSTSGTEIIFSDSSDFEQVISGEPGLMNDIQVEISHNNLSTFTLSPWILVLELTVD